MLRRQNPRVGQTLRRARANHSARCLLPAKPALDASGVDPYAIIRVGIDNEDDLNGLDSIQTEEYISTVHSGACRLNITKKKKEEIKK